MMLPPPYFGWRGGGGGPPAPLLTPLSRILFILTLFRTQRQIFKKNQNTLFLLPVTYQPDEFKGNNMILHEKCSNRIQKDENFNKNVKTVMQSFLMIFTEMDRSFQFFQFIS